MNHKKITTLVGTAILTAIVVLFQLIGSVIKFGPFSVSLVLIPIVIGGALFGILSGAWLGFVFGMVVLLSGDAAAFLGINAFGTVVTVLLKGAAAGAVAGLLAKIFKKLFAEKRTAGTVVGTSVAAIAAPIVNTGIFLIGCLVFFLPTIREWGAGAGYENVGAYMILGLVGGNFIFELLLNVVLCPTIAWIVRLADKKGFFR